MLTQQTPPTEGFDLDVASASNMAATVLQTLTTAVLVICVTWFFVAPLWRWLRGWRRSRACHWYEFIALGTSRPADVETLAGRLAPWVGTLRRDGAGVVIHRIWEDEAVRTYCGVWGVKKSGPVAGMLAKAVGSKAEFVDFAPEVGGGALMTSTRVNVDPLSAPVVEDPTGFPSWLSEQFRMANGGAFSFCLEPFGTRWGPKWFPFRGRGVWESTRLRAYLIVKERRSAGREASIGGSLGTATAVASSDVLCRARIVVSAPDWDTASNIASGFGTGLDRWYQSLRAERLRDGRRAIQLIVFPCMAAAGAAALKAFTSGGSPTRSAAIWIAAGIVSALIAAAVSPSQLEVSGNLRRALVVSIRPRYLSARWAYEAFMNGVREGDLTTEGRQKSGKAGHPHPSGVLSVSPSQLGSLLALPPITEGGVRAGVAGGRRAPAAATGTEGALLGHDPEGRGVRLADRDRFRGLFSVGDIGTGKTTLLISIWAGDLARRMRRKQEGRQPDPAIWLDTKGSGADRALAAAVHAGYEPDKDIAMVDVGSSSGPRLNLFDPALGDTSRQATAMVEAMRFAFDAGAIQDRAADVLHSAFWLALACPERIAKELGYEHGADPMRFAFWLLGGDPHLPQPAQLLQLLDPSLEEDTSFGSPVSTNLVVHEPELTAAWNKYARFVVMKERQRNELFESSRNKLAQMLTVGPLWTPDARPTVSISDILSGGWPLIVCFGARDDGSTTGHSELVAERLVSMTLLLMWEVIKVRCNSWQEHDRCLSLFSDELHMIAGNGSGSDVIASMLDLGRDRGLWPVFATQRLDQLPERTMNSISSMGTRAYFKLANLAAAEAAAADLARGDETFTEAEVSGLPDYTAAIRMHAEDVSQPPFTLRTIRDEDLPRAMLGLPAAPIVA